VLGAELGSTKTRAACSSCRRTAVGAPLVEALHLDDTILEINLTPNRGDCMSVQGVAREVAA
jgi:hypothetical protein